MSRVELFVIVPCYSFKVLAANCDGLVFIPDTDNIVLLVILVNMVRSIRSINLFRELALKF